MHTHTYLFRGGYQRRYVCFPRVTCTCQACLGFPEEIDRHTACLYGKASGGGTHAGRCISVRPMLWTPCVARRRAHHPGRLGEGNCRMASSLACMPSFACGIGAYWVPQAGHGQSRLGTGSRRNLIITHRAFVTPSRADTACGEREREREMMDGWIGREFSSAGV